MNYVHDDTCRQVNFIGTVAVCAFSTLWQFESGELLSLFIHLLVLSKSGAVG